MVSLELIIASVIAVLSAPLVLFKSKCWSNCCISSDVEDSTEDSEIGEIGEIKEILNEIKDNIAQINNNKNS